MHYVEECDVCGLLRDHSLSMCLPISVPPISSASTSSFIYHFQPFSILTLFTNVNIHTVPPTPRHIRLLPLLRRRQLRLRPAPAPPASSTGRARAGWRRTPSRATGTCAWPADGSWYRTSPVRGPTRSAAASCSCTGSAAPNRHSVVCAEDRRAAKGHMVGARVDAAFSNICDC